MTPAGLIQCIGFCVGVESSLMSTHADAPWARCITTALTRLVTKHPSVCDGIGKHKANFRRTAQAMFKVKAVETEEEKALQDKYAALRKKKADVRVLSRGGEVNTV